MPGIPFFQRLPEGKLRPISVERPFVQFRKAVYIMNEGLRFECSVGVDDVVTVMIVDRNTSRRRPRVLVEERAAANMPFSTHWAVDRLIDGFFGRLSITLPALN